MGLIMSTLSLMFIFGVMIYGQAGAEALMMRTAGVGFFSRQGMIRYFSYPIIAGTLDLMVIAKLSNFMDTNEKVAMFAFLFPLGLLFAIIINAILRSFFNSKKSLIIGQSVVCVLLIILTIMINPIIRTPHRCQECGTEDNVSKIGDGYYCLDHSGIGYVEQEFKEKYRS